ncbi:unnamed protein product [Macrosiphum euphorbiae]|nr:unnamed protein product [Macrosiphum euphorbiae]
MCGGGSGGGGGDGYTGRRRTTRSSPSRPYTITNTWFTELRTHSYARHLKMDENSGKHHPIGRGPPQPQRVSVVHAAPTAPVTDPGQQPAKRTRPSAVCHYNFSNFIQFRFRIWCYSTI